MSNDKIVIKGKIDEVLPGGQYNILLENGLKIRGHVSGKMKVHRISILPGDTVDVELSPYDLTRGRIIFRHY